MTDPIAIGTLVVSVILVAIVLFKFNVRFKHGDPETRRKRESALLLAPISIDTPFEMTGVGRSGPLMIYLDIDLSVPWQDVEATLSSCGVVLEYEVWVDDKHIETCRVSMPGEARNLKEVTSVETLGRPTRLRHACHVDKLHRMRDGAKLTVRGVAKAKPDNTINSMTVWVA